MPYETYDAILYKNCLDHLGSDNSIDDLLQSPCRHRVMGILSDLNKRTWSVDCALRAWLSSAMVLDSGTAPATWQPQHSWCNALELASLESLGILGNPWESLGSLASTMECSLTWEMIKIYLEFETVLDQE